MSSANLPQIGQKHQTRIQSQWGCTQSSPLNPGFETHGLISSGAHRSVAPVPFLHWSGAVQRILDAIVILPHFSGRSGMDWVEPPSKARKRSRFQCCRAKQIHILAGNYGLRQTVRWRQSIMEAKDIYHKLYNRKLRHGPGGSTDIGIDFDRQVKIAFLVKPSGKW